MQTFSFSSLSPSTAEVLFYTHSGFRNYFSVCLIWAPVFEKLDKVMNGLLV